MNCLKEQFNHCLNKYIEENAKDERERILYNKIFRDGKRLRPIIVFAIAENFKKTDITNLALGIEIIHNCSLIIDDMPCMDNDLMRRGKPTIHKEYGVSTAMTAATSIFIDAMRLINQSADFGDSVAKIKLFNQILCRNLGRDGLPQGQFIDLNYLKDGYSMKTTREHKDLIFKKTTTLFNLSFLLSFVVSSDKMENYEFIEHASKWFGLTFQLYDDFGDVEQDKNKDSPNFVVKYGKQETYEMLCKSINKTKKYLKLAEVNHPFFDEILGLLKSSVDEIIYTDA